MNFIEGFKKQIAEAVAQSLLSLREKNEISFAELPNFVVEVPREQNHGDFATNAAMLMAKQAKMAPRKIAELIQANLVIDPSVVERIEIAGAGFINFHLNPNWLYQVPKTIIRMGDNYGKAEKNGTKVQVEFVSANPTGNLHMGNARGGAIGDSLANILDAAGYTVEKEYYINDAGNQIDLFAQSLEARYLEALGQPFTFPEAGYAGQDVFDTVQEAIAKFSDSLLKVPEVDRREALAEFALQQKLTYIKATLQDFGIEYDVWFSESSLHDSGEVQRTMDQLAEKGYIYEKEGAMWFKSTLFGDEKDEVVVRANGVPTYFAADIAYHKNKFERGFDWIINIWGADHHGHVSRMKGAVTAIGYEPNQLDVMLMQLVRLYRGGEIVRMSKRTGVLVTLDELIEEVGKDAARFFFVMRSPDSQLDFDLELAKEETNENPVYYTQYAHARTHNMINKARNQGIAFPDINDVDLSVLKEKEELALLRRLADFTEEVQAAARTLAPQRIPHYVLDLAGLLHSFYNACRVLDAGSDELRDARIILTDAVRITVRNALTLIGVSAPERM
ncbi:MAG: arginine--tRNA ligase [Candidatus Saccharibacteria bacterium]